MEQVYIETQDLSVGYHGKALLKDIALKVKKGEILVLIGPNGAGKSTILKNIIREMQPISGGIYIKENECDGLHKQTIRKNDVCCTDGENQDGNDDMPRCRCHGTVSVYELFRKADQRRRTNCDRIAGKGICHGHCGKRFFTD